MEPNAPVILSVDDDPDIRQLISITLTAEGYRVLEAPDGATALAAATAARPDLILLDFMMPGINGIEVCARLQESPTTAHIPVVFLTAVTGEVERARAFALGAVDYVVKPPSPAGLKEVVERHLRTAGVFERLAGSPDPTGMTERYGPAAFARFREALAERFALGPEAAAFLGAMTPATIHAVTGRLGIAPDDMVAVMGSVLEMGVVRQIPGRDVRLGVLPAPFCKSNLVVPVRNAAVGDAFVVSNPFNWELLEALELANGPGRALDVLLATPDTVLAVFEMALEQVRRRIEVDPADYPRPIDAPSAENRPVTVAMDHVLATAFTFNAEDLLIDPGAARADIRIKVAGDLRDLVGVSGERAAMMTSRLKALAGMDIAEKRRPQRGSLEVGFGTSEYDLIVVTTPTQFGESLAARMIPVGRPPRTLVELGMTPAQSEMTTRMLAEPRGLVLVCGAAGSGKTTTAHSLLAGFSAASRSIVSVEDPIEYRIPFATQQQVDERAGVSAVGLLASAARRSPDVLFVGEITSAELAQATLGYARANGLVVATINASDPYAALGRLEEWGITRTGIIEALIGVLGQSLVRTPCPACRVMNPADDDERALLARFFIDIPDVLARPVGCSVCGGTGYHGRTAVFETLPADQNLSAAIRSGLPWNDIRTAMAGRSGVSAPEAMLSAVASGVVALDEPVREVLSRASDSLLTPVTSAEEASSGTSQPRVLIVDDSEDVMEFMSTVLSDAGWIVEQARNGVEALRLLGASEFDLVLSDLNMPLMGGFDFFERASRGESAPPAILYSASRDHRDEVRSLRLGAADYLRLPVHPEVLRLRSRRATDRR